MVLCSYILSFVRFRLSELWISISAIKCMSVSLATAETLRLLLHGKSHVLTKVKASSMDVMQRAKIHDCKTDFQAPGEIKTRKELILVEINLFFVKPS